MTELEHENVLHFLGQAITKAITKHRKDHPNHPSTEEYCEVLAEVVLTIAKTIDLPKRKPGRPKKERPPEQGEIEVKVLAFN